LFDYSIKMPVFMPFYGYVQMYSGRHVVEIDLQPLGLKSESKEWGIQGTEV
jgi:hypothetical protein